MTSLSRDTLRLLVTLPQDPQQTAAAVLALSSRDVPENLDNSPVASSVSRRSPCRTTRPRTSELDGDGSVTPVRRIHSSVASTSQGSGPGASPVPSQALQSQLRTIPRLPSRYHSATLFLSMIVCSGIPALGERASTTSLRPLPPQWTQVSPGELGTPHRTRTTYQEAVDR